MKKAGIILLGLALVVFAMAGCGREEQSREAQDKPVDTTLAAPSAQPAAAVYYCPMDTDVVSDKPGKCSKCGMDLIEKMTESK